MYLYNTNFTGNVIADNSISENGNYGLYMQQTVANRVQGNTASGNSIGYRFNNTSKNMIFQNVSLNNITAFSLSTNDLYGPVVSTSGALSSTGDASHPMANFSR